MEEEDEIIEIDDRTMFSLNVQRLKTLSFEDLNYLEKYFDRLAFDEPAMAERYKKAYNKVKLKISNVITYRHNEILKSIRLTKDLTTKKER